MSTPAVLFSPFVAQKEAAQAAPLIPLPEMER
jgi:hypothetical protein